MQREKPFKFRINAMQHSVNNGNNGNKTLKQIESLNAMLDDLDQHIRKNRDAIQKRMSKLNAKAEKLRKEIERTERPGRASQSRDASSGRIS